MQFFFKVLLLSLNPKYDNYELSVSVQLLLLSDNLARIVTVEMLIFKVFTFLLPQEVSSVCNIVTSPGHTHSQLLTGIFTGSALWAGSVIESRCPCACLSVPSQ